MLHPLLFSFGAARRKSCTSLEEYFYKCFLAQFISGLSEKAKCFVAPLSPSLEWSKPISCLCGTPWACARPPF